MKIKQWFITVFSKIGQFLSVLFTDVLQKELEVVLPIAMQIVTDISKDTTLLTSDEKRSVAINRIKNQLVEAQANIGLSVVSLAIELAVQKLKQDQNNQ